MSEQINVIGLSGGKDSTALFGWAIHESGYPRDSIYPAFCDTENEYQEVYDQIDALDLYGQARGVRPIARLRATGAWATAKTPLFLALALWKGRFPSARARFCTDHLKIRPTKKFIEELQKAGDLVTHSGVRASESIERSTMTEFSRDIFDCPHRRPLLAWTINDIWLAHKRWGLPINRLYFDGWKRVGCRLCVMSSKADVRRTVQKRPSVIDLYRDWEQRLGRSRAARGSVSAYSSWFSRRTVPLPQRSLRVDTKSGPMMVPTIDDVARWSTTSRGGVQQCADFMFAESDFNIDDVHHPCQAGFCE